MNDARFAPTKERKNGRLITPGSRNGMQALLAWHRRLGLVTAVVVLLLAVTGILLNHAHRFGLDQVQVTANWMLRWYGFPPVEKPLSYRVGDYWVSWTGSRLYLQDKPVIRTNTAPVGATAATGEMLSVAFPDMLVVVGPNSELVELMGAESLPGKLERIGITDGGMLVVATAQGSFTADANFIAWRPASTQAEWSRAEEAPAALLEHLSTAERGSGLSVERLLQDLHSGRIVGSWGPWFMDAAAIVFVILAITGIIYWWTRRGRIPLSPKPSDDRRIDQ
jgi:hypothetical protein